MNTPMLESALTDCLRIFAARGRRIREEAQEAASPPNVCEAGDKPAAGDAAGPGVILGVDEPEAAGATRSLP